MSAAVTIEQIAPAGLPPVWPVAAPMIAQSIPKRPALFTIEGVLRGLLEQRYLLWIAIEDSSRILGAVVTRPVQYELCRTISVWLVGGTGLMRWWRPMEAAITAVARAHGCAYLEGGGRDGWKRWGTVHDLGPVLYKEI